MTAGSTDALERLIARCWSEALGIDDPAPDQDFFELGGNSIQALGIAGEVGEQLPFEASLVALFFENPTIGGFARAIAAEVPAEDLALLDRPRDGST